MALYDRTGAGNHIFTDEEVARYWDANAGTWADYVGRGFDVFRIHLNNPSFLRLVGDQRNRKVLDAGCGEGHNTRILAAAGAKMTGVDISPKMIRFAGAAEKRQPFGIQYKVASFSDLSPFRAASFDTVVSFMALMDGPEYPGAVREIYRVLKPGGNLFFNISHPCFMTKGMDWVRNEAGEPVKLAVSDYFSKEHYVERWSFGAAGENVEPFSIPYFGRTLSDYINPLADTGFVLRKLQEPRPSLRLCHEHPEFLKWRNTAAIFLHVHASKP